MMRALDNLILLLLLSWVIIVKGRKIETNHLALTNIILALEENLSENGKFVHKTEDCRLDLLFIFIELSPLVCSLLIIEGGGDYNNSKSNFGNS